MITILCFGDSNTWGSIPGTFNPVTGLSERYNKQQRWPNILQKQLGEHYHVIEEAIGGRTTNLNSTLPNRPHKNGLALLAPSLDAHYPIHIVIFMLGTNDTQVQYNRSPPKIADGMRQLLQLVKTCNKGPSLKHPKILLIAPPSLIFIPNLNNLFNLDSIQKSECLRDEYRRLAEQEDCNFLDAASCVTVSTIDGIHLDDTACEKLGHKIAQVIELMS